MKKYLLILSLLLTSIASATPKSDDDKIISNRPQNKTRFIALIRLDGPALLEKAKREDGRTIISDQAKERIQREQAELIGKLTSMSDKIQVLHRYRFVLNALAVVAPIELKDKIVALDGVSYMENEAQFMRSKITKSDRAFKPKKGQNLAEVNSVSFIGADKLHAKGVLGKGIKVGVLDSGIDFTHKMLGGTGNPEDFKAVDPSKETPHFPNKKVVGGIDLVGTDYDASSPVFEQKIPKPDNNPIDEGWHGTHVAGSIAGIGDGENTYSGVAPEAVLHSIKVFGANGSTGDGVIIAGLEYAMDPNGDLNPEDQLDVVNLSLGGSFGKEHLLYKLAIKNLVRGGVTTVIAAGNEGHNAYIVGSPSTTDEALSVAASVDNMDHNYKFDAVEFKAEGLEDLLAMAVEGEITLPIAEAGDVTGKLIEVGPAIEDFSEELKAKLKGNVALIDRGFISFDEKLKRAESAGVIGVVMVNNSDGDAFEMGGDGEFMFPGIMINKALGEKIKEQMKSKETFINFQTDKKIETPEIIDTLTRFSSRGPRMNDSHLKPEIAAPGYNIISAGMGEGIYGIEMSGTSMAAPHMAGVMALMVEKFPGLTPLELKAVVLATAKTMDDDKDELYPIALQGAGRVQVDKAAEAKLIMTPSTLSLGEVSLSSRKVIRKKITLKNISSEELSLTPKFETSPTLNIVTEEKLVLKAGEEKEITLTMTIANPVETKTSQEMDGRVLFMSGESEVARIPLLAVVNKVSRVKAESVNILATDEDDMAGAAVDVLLSNTGKNMGHALLFNLLGKDKRKVKVGDVNSTRSRQCDLQSAGYRVISRDGVKFFQVGVKLYNPISTWQGCEVTVLLDKDSDGTPEQELAGLINQNLPGLRGLGFNSYLLDATKVRKLRGEFEESYARTLGTEGELPEENYSEAIIHGSNMMAYEHSTISVVETPLSELATTKTGELSIKLAILNEDPSAIEADDYLGDLTKWKKINPTTDAMSFMDMPEVVEVKSGQKQKVELTKGEGNEDLLILYPMNRSTKTHTRRDNQSELPSLSFGVN